MTEKPLRDLLISAILWLPLSFAVWFYVAGIFMLPVAVLSDFVFSLFLPGIINGVEQHGVAFEILTNLTPAGYETSDQGVPIIAYDVNPMIYGYGIPLVAGLTMATPDRAVSKTLKLLGGVLAILVVQTWGVFWEVLKNMQFRTDASTATRVADMGLSPEVVALGYQFGYLILPSAVPIIYWILVNRKFVENLVDRKRIA